MDLGVERADRACDTVLTVSGELDIASVRMLRGHVDEVLTTGPGVLLLDLTPLTFIDSTGCRELTSAAKRAAEVGARVELVVPGTNRRVRRIVDFVGLAELVPLHESVPAP